MEQPFRPSKSFSIQELLDKKACRFPRVYDEHVFKEKDRILSHMEDAFLEQRPAQHIAKLACMICFARRRLAINAGFSSLKARFDVRVFPSVLHFPFGSKSVLCIVAHADLSDRYELFHQEHILHIIRSLFKEVQLVTDSVYAITPPKSTIKTLSFEICKQDGSPINPDEIRQLQELLQREIPYSVEKLVSRLFMIQNEEEIFKNILTLSREIRSASDPPQVILQLDSQTSSTVLLTIIMVAVHKDEQPNVQNTLQECITKGQLQAECWVERSQIVRYIKKKQAVEALVLKVRVQKKSFPLRTDGSLNFHLIREKVCHLLTDAIGAFRDYNGGIISKQIGILSSFKQKFPQTSSDLLENFYYALSPIEAQTTLPLRTLKAFFDAFLEARAVELRKPSDFFLKIHEEQKQLIISIRLADKNCTLDSIISPLNCKQSAVSYVLADQNAYFMGYLVDAADMEKRLRLTEAMTSALMDRKRQLENRQILRLSLSSIVSLDPRIGGDNTSSTVLKMLFEGLTRTNRYGRLENGVAQQVEISPDQKTYTFQLRNTRWSDGSLVLASDFEYAWKKVLSPLFKTPFAYLFYPIKNANLAKKGSVPVDAVGITSPSDKTLKVELEFPAPYFLELTALPIYSPVQHLIDQQRPNWPFEEGSEYVCNGAFCLKTNNFNGQHELVKNQAYWDHENIQLNKIIVLKNDLQNPYELFQQGMCDWTGRQMAPPPPTFVTSTEDEIIVTPNTGVYWVIFNTTKFPFNHVKLRQALALGINRSRMQTLLNASPAISPLPVTHSQLQKSILSNYSKKKSQTLFKEALVELGLSHRDFPTISIIHSVKPPHNQVMEYIKEEWENAFGIHCDLKPLKWNLLFSKQTEGDFQVSSSIWEPWIDDPIYTLNSFTDGALNISRWAHQRYHEILRFAEKETIIKKRLAYYLQAETILLEELPIVPLFSTSTFALKKKNLTIGRPPNNVNFKWAYFN